MDKIAMVLIFLPMFVFSQQYTEASGQTPVFFLKAGTTTHPVFTINLKHSGYALSSCFMADKSGAIRIQGFRSATKILIYNMLGTLMATFTSANGGPVSFSSNLPNGIYFVRLKAINNQRAFPLTIQR
ncbi:MAG: T9SS type A sorting domain-containing protein [Chitinivibrionales bacterium]